MKAKLVTFIISLMTLLSGIDARAAETRGYCEFTMSLEVPARDKAGTRIPSRSMRVTGKAWQAGDRARIDTYSLGRATGSSVIVTPEAVYTLQNSRKQAVKKQMTRSFARRCLAVSRFSF